jgi:hypothetical protein
MMNKSKSGLLVTILFIFSMLVPLLMVAPSSSAATKKSEGKFVLIFKDSKNPKNAETVKILKSTHKFKSLVSGFNKMFNLPNGDVKIILNDGTDYHFHPKLNSILIGYDEIQNDISMIRKYNPDVSQELIEKFVINNNIFMMYHEIGHALVYNLDIPIPSNAETAVDYLSALVSLNYSQNGYELVTSGIITFDIWNRENIARERKIKSRAHVDATFWSEHAGNKKRLYNILCVAYGKNPSKLMEVLKKVDDDKLIDFLKYNAKRCRGLYNRIYGDWFKLLIPYYKTLPTEGMIK